MYVPKHFAFTQRNALIAFIRAHPFGILVSVSGGGPAATHVPFVVFDRSETLTLGLHVAKANPHWELVQGTQVLAIFQGPHGFVSASWYAQPQVSVPTWNYSAVHCAGRATLASADATQKILEAMVHTFEGERGWSMNAADPEYVERMKSGIVAIEITVTSIEGKRKHSQNRTEEDRERVLRQLDAASPELARDMRAYGLA